MTYLEIGSSVSVQRHFDSSSVALPQVPVPFPLPAGCPSLDAVSTATLLRPELIRKDLVGKEVTSHC